MTQIFRVLDRMNRILVPIGLAMLMIMVVEVTINVVGRAAFGAPLFGSVEVVELSSVILVSCVAAYTQLKKQNIIVGLVVDRFNPGLRAAFSAATTLFSLVIIVVLIYAGSIYAVETLGYGEITHVFQITMVPFRFVWVIGLIILALALATQTVENLMKAVKR